MHLTHRLGTTRQQGGSIVALCALLVALFSSNTLSAQNPALGFVNGIGSASADRANAVATSADGTIYVTGTFSGTVDFDPSSGTANLVSRTGTGNGDIFVASYDPSGNYRWAFSMGGGRADGEAIQNEGMSVALDNAGNVVVTGVFAGTTDFDPGAGTATMTATVVGAYYNMFVAKYNPAGGYVWAFRVDGVFNSALDVDAAGNIAVTGTFAGPADFNPGSGTNTLTSTRNPRGLSGYSSDIFVAKYSSSGSYLWAFRLGSDGSDLGSAIAVDNNGNILITGAFVGTIDFNPGSAKLNLTSAGNQDAYVAKYSSSGAYVWAFRIGGSAHNDYGVAIDTDQVGAVALTGLFRGTVDFDPSTSTRNLTSAGSQSQSRSDIFIAHYTSSGAYRWAFNPAVAAVAIHHTLTVDADGYIYLAGNFYGPNNFDPLLGSIVLTGNTYGVGGFIVKYTRDADFEYAHRLDATQNAPVSKGIAVDGSGNVVVVGSFSATVDFDSSDSTANVTSAGSGDIFVAQYTQPWLAKRATSTSKPLAMNVAPNPFTDAFTFTVDGSIPARIEIIDMMGERVETVETVGTVVMGSELPAGTYLVRLTQGDERRQTLVQKVR